MFNFIFAGQKDESEETKEKSRSKCLITLFDAWKCVLMNNSGEIMREFLTHRNSCKNSAKISEELIGKMEMKKRDFRHFDILIFNQKFESSQLYYFEVWW